MTEQEAFEQLYIMVNNIINHIGWERYLEIMKQINFKIATEPLTNGKKEFIQKGKLK